MLFTRKQSLITLRSQQLLVQVSLLLAAMIFGRWNPSVQCFRVCSLVCHSHLRLSVHKLPLFSSIPSVYLEVAPYVLTIVVLAAFFGKAVAPKADGVNYIKSK